jgi:hypothetical protein
MFYASSLTFMLVYLWSRRNPGMQIRCAPCQQCNPCPLSVPPAMLTLPCSPPPRRCPPPGSLLGLVAFQAPYLPWVLMTFSLLLGHDVSSDMLGIAAGHIYYYFAGACPG